MLVPISNQPVQQDLSGVILGVPLKSPGGGTGKDFQEALLQDLNRQDSEAAAAQSALMGVPMGNPMPVVDTSPSTLMPEVKGVDSKTSSVSLMKSIAGPEAALKGAPKDAQTLRVAPLPGAGSEQDRSISPVEQDGALPELMKSLSSDGVDVSRLESWEKEGVSFEGLKVMAGEEKSEAPVKESAPQSWSTQDFLSLRFGGQQREQGAGSGFGQNQSKESLPGVKKAASQVDGDSRDPVAFTGVMEQVPQFRSGVERQSLEAPVTRSPSGQIRLTDEAVGALAGRVNGLRQARQDGEIKIRLRPDHLGELIMNVRTQGQQVLLQIKATDGESRKILEESLSSLRDSLSQQNLSLSKVEVVSVPTTSFAAPDTNSNLMSDSGAQRQDFGGQGGGFSGNGAERESGQERRFEESVAGGNLNLSRSSRAVRSRSASGLDLIA